MFPLKDDIPSQRQPLINYTLIGVCAFVFLYQLITEAQGLDLIGYYGMIPSRVLGFAPAEKPLIIPLEDNSMNHLIIPPAVIPPVWTLLTSMFLHGGLLHFLGNMWYLYIFGDNVEDRYGHLGYLWLYLVSGICASLFQIVSDPTSHIPTIGASGAIAGVMGAYFALFKHAQVATLIPAFPIWLHVNLPASSFLAIWFVLQLLGAVTSIPGRGGVAFWAHAGGFVVGWVLTYIFRFQRYDAHPEWTRQVTPDIYDDPEPLW